MCIVGGLSKQDLSDESSEVNEDFQTHHDHLPLNSITRYFECLQSAYVWFLYPNKAINYHRNIIQNPTSQTNLRNLQVLKDFPYDYEYRRNPSNGKLVIVYICKFDNWEKEFLSAWNLLDHVRMHQGIKPFVCPYCPKTFTQNGNLRKHVYRHNNPNLQSRRRYKCKFCKSRFTERYNYKVIVGIWSIQMSFLIAILFKFMNLIINSDSWTQTKIVFFINNIDYQMIV